MEKVFAYKAFNGKLFDTEEKCLAYEHKLAQYPKIKVKRDTMIVGKLDLVCVTYQEKPSSQRYTHTYYDIIGTNVRVYTNDTIYPIDNLGERNPNLWLAIEEISVRQIAHYGTFDNAIADICCKEFNRLENGAEMEYKHSEKDKMWNLYDRRTFRGMRSMCGTFCKIIKVSKNDNEIDIFKKIQRNLLLE